MGVPEMKDVENRLFASELNCAIYSVDHSLAPESPHPAPVEDIYSVFAWLHANACQLGFYIARIPVSRAKVEAVVSRRLPHSTPVTGEGPKFAFQHLIYPMIDDRMAVRGGPVSLRW